MNLQMALSILEIHPNDFDVFRAPSYADALERLKVFKDKVKRQRKVVAMIHHPDRGGNTKAMQLVNEAYDFLLSLRVNPPRRRVVIHFSPMYYSSSNSTNATTFWG